jgi:hypothetical protein
MGSFNLDTNYLLASLFWSAVGGGFWLYGKKQRSGPPMVGGIGLIAISWVVESALWMTVAAVAIIAGIYIWSRNED